MKACISNVLTGAAAAALLLTCCSPGAVAGSRPSQKKPTGGGEPFAVRLAAEGDELSILFPAKPSVYRFKAGYSYVTGGELIKEERVATAYAGGVVYVLRLLRAGNPRRALRDYGEGERGAGKSLVGPVSRQDVTVSGNAGRQEEARRKYPDSAEQFYMKKQYFATRRYLCVISATARDGASAEMNDFFASLRFGGQAAAGAADDMEQEGQVPGGQAPFAGEVYEARDVTRPALVVWQPPLHGQLINAAGDLDLRRYEIQVRVVLTPTGEVAELKVRQPVSRDAMTIAAEMTRHAKFIPAELNGRPVAQSYTFKYTLGH